LIYPPSPKAILSLALRTMIIDVLEVYGELDRVVVEDETMATFTIEIDPMFLATAQCFTAQCVYAKLFL
jgi:hypothetical protein